MLFGGLWDDSLIFSHGVGNCRVASLDGSSFRRSFSLVQGDFYLFCLPEQNSPEFLGISYTSFFWNLKSQFESQIWEIAIPCSYSAGTDNRIVIGTSITSVICPNSPLQQK